MDQLPPVQASTQGRTCSLGMYPDWESSHSFSVYGTTLQTTELHQPGLFLLILN